LIFRNPFAWIGVAALLVPIAIHLLVRAPAQPIVLASLRFVPASTMRAVRRRLLNDGGLLALRIGTLLLAVAALADPLATPACRRTAWNARLMRAVVADPRADAVAVERIRRDPPASGSTAITNADLAAGLAQALVWLDAAPPARREVVFVGPFPLGALDAAALRAAPASTGLRFVRTPIPPSTATVAVAPVTALDARQRVLARTPQVTFDGDRLVTSSGVTAPVDGDRIEQAPHGWRVRLLGVSVLGPDAARHELRAALAAAMAVGVSIPASTATHPIVVLADQGNLEAFAPPVKAVSATWMADVATALASDSSLARELRGTKSVGSDALADPWRAVVRDDDGRVVAAVAATAQESAALVIRVRAPIASPALAAVVRSALLRGADAGSLVRAEVLAIPDAWLAGWTRPAGEVDGRAVDAPHESDRPWLWGAVLMALAIETFLRRRPARTPTLARETGSHDRAA
jgi:Aerotolerance regulator N-terminal